MGLSTVLAEAERRRKSLVVYAREETDIADQFGTRNAVVEHRPLPSSEDDGFVLIRDGDEFRGALSLSLLREFLSPPIRRPWDLDVLSPGYRALFELLDDTVFASLDRRQLLATVRELEDRAWRVGRGTLRVGFQSYAAFHDQESVYLRLAEETDLDIHIYVAPETLTVDRSNWPVTFHTEPADEIGRYWSFMFDGGGADENKCALVAEEREADSYYGFWTYEPSVVDRATESLTEVEPDDRRTSETE